MQDVLYCQNPAERFSLKKEKQECIKLEEWTDLHKVIKISASNKYCLI